MYTLEKRAGEPRHETVATGSTRREAGRPLIVSLQIAFFIFAIGSWQALTSIGVLDPFFFDRPGDVALRIWQWLSSGFIWEHLIVTLTEAMLAFVIGTVLGVIFGLTFARVRLLAAVFNPYIRMFNALPRVILAPIFLLWFGLGMPSKVALGVTLVFMVVFFNTYQGVREVNPVLVNNVRMLHASQRQLLRYVYLPSAMTWIFSSLHTSIGFALVAAVVGEYLGASRGIGFVVAQAEGVFDTTGVFAGLILTSVVVLGIDLLIERLEKYLLRWRPPA
jgi:NitT/TauT family transport system permease protein